MNTANFHAKTQPFKTVAQKYSPNDVSIILFTDEKTTHRMTNQEERCREKAPV